MKTLEDLKYTKTHEWVEFTGENTAKIGITDHAQEELGDLVFVNLPEAGDNITAGEAFADVESVKAVSDINSPVSGIIKEVNSEIADNPAMINEDPYGAWFIEAEDINGMAELLTAEEYEAFVKEESK